MKSSTEGSKSDPHTIQFDSASTFVVCLSLVRRTGADNQEENLHRKEDNDVISESTHRERSVVLDIGENIDL